MPSTTRAAHMQLGQATWGPASSPEANTVITGTTGGAAGYTTTAATWCPASGSGATTSAGTTRRSQQDAAVVRSWAKLALRWHASACWRSAAAELASSASCHVAPDLLQVH